MIRFVRTRLDAKLLTVALFFAPANQGLFLDNAAAAEPIRFARSPDISPDGTQVVFSYLGDLWIVDAAGGVARHLTMHEKHDIGPVFSPDGKRIAFSSNRHGTYDVFVIPVEGGRPTRLTYDSADDFATGWSPDGDTILFTSARQSDFPPRPELYTIPAKGGRAVRVSAFEGRDGAYAPAGERIAYVRGPGTWYRKGYRGSSNDDIWISDADGSNNRQFTHFNGQDNHPQWSPDGKTLYWVSECLGTPANIVRQEVDALPGPAQPRAVTHHKDDAVRRARLSGNGEWLVYECGADLYVQSTKGGQPRKLLIEVHADDKTNPEKITTFTSGASEYSLSRDERTVAFVVHGSIFVMPRQAAVAKAKRLMDEPFFDHGVAWSPDSKKILFLSDRGGHEDIYLLESDDPETSDLAKANHFKVKRLTNTPEAEIGVTFTPDGKRVSFLRAGKLMTMNLDGADEKVLIKDGVIFDYEWSPDGAWLVYARQDGSFASELFIVPATGPTAADPPRNLTRFATYNGGVTWSRTGNKLAFISHRRKNVTSAFVLSLFKPAAPGSSPGLWSSKSFDWDDIHLRVKQPVNMLSTECAISGDGTRIAFRGIADGQSDLWVAASDGSQVARLSTGNTNPSQIQWSRIFPSMIYFRDGTGHIRTATLGLGASGVPATATLSSIPFQAKMTIGQDQVFTEMFNQSWRALHESFYDASFHGANWNAIKEKYQPLVKHVVLKEDLYALISLMMGELNASHLGISGPATVPEQATAELGLIFDESYDGPGLRIAEILRGGPADQRGISVRPGDILLKIDNKDLNADQNLAQLLNDRAGETVSVLVAPEANLRKATRVNLPAVSRKQIAELMYERWIRKNAEKVHALSKGTLGYIHIPSMNEAGLDRFVRALYSDCFDKEGIVLDIRYNGGGYTHEQVLSYLSGKEHTFFHQRDGSWGMALNSDDRRWTKPLVLLINNRSFSDAEIFPHAFRTLGLGKLVGQATGGHVIGTREITLIDGSTFRTPRIGVKTHTGVNMDKTGVIPDVVVDVHPDELARLHDAQLERAVSVLTEDVAVWKKNRPPLARNPVANSPTGSAGPGAGNPGPRPGAVPGPQPNPQVAPRKED
jgi:tricorn protease